MTFTPVHTFHRTSGFDSISNLLVNPDSLPNVGEPATPLPAALQQRLSPEQLLLEQLSQQRQTEWIEVEDDQQGWAECAVGSTGLIDCVGCCLGSRRC